MGSIQMKPSIVMVPSTSSTSEPTQKSSTNVGCFTEPTPRTTVGSFGDIDTVVGSVMGLIGS